MDDQHRVLDELPIEQLSDHQERGGGHGLDAARHRRPGALIDLIDRSGLRGRGGAGFPTGRKWRTVAARAGSAPVPVVVNAAEGEPGTFKDRALLRRNPHRVLEGACIAAHAVGATEIIVATKASFVHEIERLRRAITELDAAGWLDGLTVQIVTGPGEYLFGEETALLEVLDGRPAFPRVTPPYRRGVAPGDGALPGRHRWADGPAVLVDNVETLANLPAIVRHGADWFREVGTDRSPGTIICTVTGGTRHGVGEFAMGTPLRDVLRQLGGELQDHPVAAVLSGVSNPPLGPDQLGTPLSYEHFAAIGSGLGSASFIVVDDQVPMRAVAAGVARFLAVESCGQCEPCKRDGLAVAADLAADDAAVAVLDVRRDAGDRTAAVRRRLDTVARGARCALAGQTERVVGRLLDLAATSPSGPAPGGDPRPEQRFPVVPLVDLVDGRVVLDLSHLEKRPDWSYPGDEVSHAWPAQHLADHGVVIRPAHTPEPANGTTADDGHGPGAVHIDASSSATHVLASEPTESLRQLGRSLEARLDAFRRAEPDDQSTARHELGDELRRHQLITERVVYPLVARLVEDGSDLAWYPLRHEQQAARLLDRLEHGEPPLSPRMVDDLCADLHTAIIELDRAVIPALHQALAGDAQQSALLADAIDELAALPTADPTRR